MHLTKPQRFLFAVLTNAALLGLVEGALRFVPAPPAAGTGAPIVLVPANRGEVIVARRDPAVGWCFAPNEILSNFEERSNSLAFRGAEPTPAAGEPARRILCLGSGTTFGLGVRSEETFASFLDRWLRRDGTRRWEVLNAAVPGHTIVQSLALLRVRGRELRPSVVVVCSGVWDAYTPATFTDDDVNLGVLGGGRGAGFLGWLGEFRLARWARFALQRWEAPPPVKASSELDEMWRTIQRRPSGPRVPGTKFRRALVELAAEARRLGAEIVFVTPPLPRDTARRFPASEAYARVVLDVASESGFALADARAALAAAEESGDERLFVDELRPSRGGHARIASAIADALRRAGVASIPNDPLTAVPSSAISLGASRPLGNPAAWLAASPGRTIRLRPVELPRGALLQLRPSYLTPAAAGLGAPRPYDPTKLVEFEAAIVEAGKPRRVVYSQRRIVAEEDPWCRTGGLLIDLGELGGRRVSIELVVRGDVLLASWGPAAVVSYD